MKKLNIFHGEDEYEILVKNGLFNQAFDYQIGYYNKKNQTIDIENKNIKDIKIRAYTCYHIHPFRSSLNTIAIYLPFNIYIRDKIVRIELNNNNKYR